MKVLALILLLFISGSLAGAADPSPQMLLRPLERALRDLAEAQRVLAIAQAQGTTVIVPGHDPAEIRTWLRQQTRQLEAITATLRQQIQDIRSAIREGSSVKRKHPTMQPESFQ